MSHESRVMSHEQRAIELAEGFAYVKFRTIDFEDAVDVAIDKMEGVLTELVEIDVTAELKDQAAFCVGQYFLEGLAHVETDNIVGNLADTVSVVFGGKPYLVMASVPNSRTK